MHISNYNLISCPFSHIAPTAHCQYTAGDIPIALEMSAICQAFNLAYVLEPFKGYPREPYVLGRVRVRLELPDGSLAHAEIPDSESCNNINIDSS
jgi:SRP19 protein